MARNSASLTQPADKRSAIQCKTADGAVVPRYNRNPKVKKMYECADGTVWSVYTEAQAHQRTIEFVGWLREQYGPTMKEVDTAMVALFILKTWNLTKRGML